MEVIFIPGKSLKKEIEGKKTQLSNKIKRKSINFFKQICIECYMVYHTKSKKDRYCYSCKFDKNIIKTVKKYSGHFFRIKKVVLERDDHKCQCCNMTSEESFKIHKKQLSIHHIDGNTRNNKLENLITLCLQCHASLTLKYKDKFYRHPNIRDLFPKEIIRGANGNRLIFKPE